jgi:hypothetical protein
MGVVDLVNLDRLHCNSTIMGQYKWWLKLFFTLSASSSASPFFIVEETNLSHVLSLAMIAPEQQNNRNSTNVTVMLILHLEPMKR